MATPLQARVARWLVANQLWLSLLLLFVWTEETAWRLQGDASYDLLNYHLYGPFALLHGKWGVDVAPAQGQGFLPPTSDIPFYLLARHLGDVHLLNLLLALPAAVAIGLAFLITLHLLRATGVIERLIALAAVVTSATGAATHPLLATSMSDMIPCSLVLGAMLLLLRQITAAIPGHAFSLTRQVLPGLLVGMALGLKLTFSYAAAGLAVALLAQSDLPLRARFRLATLFCISAGIGALAVGGWWWLLLWQLTGNPIFPLYNNLFQSPLTWPGDFVDRRFLPHGTLQWLFYPVYWALSRAPLVTESDVPMRDPRMALALLAAILILFRSLNSPGLRSGPVRLISVFFLASHALWGRQFSILRYLSVLELLSATMIAMLAFEVAQTVRARRAVLACSVLLLVTLRLYTVYPNWGRMSEQGGKPLEVNIPTLPPDALVLILDAAPLSYLALFQHDSVRFMGTNNNIIQPQQDGPLQRTIRAAIAAQHANLYGVEKPDFDKGGADRTLAAYGLHRAGCDEVTGRIVGTTTWLCRLAKAAPP